MKNKTIALGGIWAITLGLAVAAHATTFDLTFTDFNSVVQGYGVVNGTQNQDGTFSLTSGYWDAVAGPEAGLTGALSPDASAPNYIYSPSGYFIFDSLLYPNSPGLAAVDYYGLLFTSANSPSEINIYSDSPSQYDEYFNNDVDILGTLRVQEVTPAVLNTPDHASSARLLGVAVFALAILRRAQTGVTWLPRKAAALAKAS